MSLISRLISLKGKPITVKTENGIEIKIVNADRGFDIIVEVEEDCFLVKHANNDNVVYPITAVARIVL